MTQAEKAKHYDEAIINGSRLWECGLITRETYENIFPELKDEDEKTRKEILSFLREGQPYYSPDSTKRQEWAAWLEKQSSLKDIIDRHKDSWYNEGKIAGMAEGLTNDEKYQQGWHDALEKQSEQKPITDFSDLRTWKYIVDAVLTEKEGIGQYLDSPFTEEIAKKLQKRFGNIEQMNDEQDPNDIKPKFHEGDWVACNSDDLRSPLRIVSISDTEYRVKDTQGIPARPKIWYLDKHYHRWTINDAKDGDVLFDGNNILLFKEVNNWRNIVSYLVYSKDYSIREHFISSSDRINPATKEQRDILFAKMNELGYEWDAERKEPKRI